MAVMIIARKILTSTVCVLLFDDEEVGEAMIRLAVRNEDKVSDYCYGAILKEAFIHCCSQM